MLLKCYGIVKKLDGFVKSQILIAEYKAPNSRRTNLKECNVLIVRRCGDQPSPRFRRDRSAFTEASAFDLSYIRPELMSKAGRSEDFE
jgi:hypothetical protein